MAITQMVGEERRGEAGTFEVNNYHGAEKGRVSHGRTCPHAGQYDLSGTLSDDCVTETYDRCWVHKGLVMETTHQGQVLYTGEHNWYDDSDFYAMVWDDEAGKPVEVTYASTRGWTYPNHAEADATPEVQAKYEAWRAAREAERRAAEAAREAATPRRGKRLRVVKGRKVPVGVEGECIWTGNGHYGPRVGIKDDEGEVHWTAASNVQVINNEII